MTYTIEAQLPRLVDRVLAVLLAGTLGGVRVWV